MYGPATSQSDASISYPLRPKLQWIAALSKHWRRCRRTQYHCTGCLDGERVSWGLARSLERLASVASTDCGGQCFGVGSLGIGVTAMASKQLLAVAALAVGFALCAVTASVRAAPGVAQLAAPANTAPTNPSPDGRPRRPAPSPDALRHVPPGMVNGGAAGGNGSGDNGNTANSGSNSGSNDYPPGWGPLGPIPYGPADPTGSITASGPYGWTTHEGSCQWLYDSCSNHCYGNAYQASCVCECHNQQLICNGHLAHQCPTTVR
jgi:hypothetical protein